MKNQTKIAFVHAEHGHNDKSIGAGIAEYVRSQPNLQLIAWPDPSLESLSFLKKQGCEGAIVNVQLASKANRLLKAGLPIIAYSTLQNFEKIPYISTDSQLVAQMAYDYLSKKQFKNFAFFGLTEARWTIERLEAFSKILSDAGQTFHAFRSEPKHIPNSLTSFIQLWIGDAMKKDSKELTRWLKSLPKPVAILASCDILGCFLSTLVQECDLTIPNDVAILGIDNNESICNICNVPMSSIALNLNKAGFDAAYLLHQIILGEEKLAGQQIQIEPVHVIERPSTDILAIEDESVILAMQYIHSHSDEPIQVGDIADYVCVSKRSLQSKFQYYLKRSIYEVVQQSHFQRARVLLIETNLTIENVAMQSGFGSSSKMRKAFLSITGQLPHHYRQIHQAHK